MIKKNKKTTNKEKVISLVKDSDIKYSDLVISNDNILEAITWKVNNLIEVFSKYENDAEKVTLFKNEVVSLVRMSQDAGVIQLLKESLEDNK